MSHFEREIGDLLRDLEESLRDAGWNQINWAAPNNSGVIHRSLRPLSGTALAQNVEIELDPLHRDALLPAANALIEALNRIGIRAS
jgi:hypothetical protein